MHIIYKCGHGPHNTLWWATGSRPVLYTKFLTNSGVPTGNVIRIRKFFANLLHVIAFFVEAYRRVEQCVNMHSKVWRKKAGHEMRQYLRKTFYVEYFHRTLHCCSEPLQEYQQYSEVEVFLRLIRSRSAALVFGLFLPHSHFFKKKVFVIFVWQAIINVCLDRTEKSSGKELRGAEGRSTAGSPSMNNRIIELKYFDFQLLFGNKHPKKNTWQCFLDLIYWRCISDWI